MNQKEYRCIRPCIGRVAIEWVEFRVGAVYLICDEVPFGLMLEPKGFPDVEPFFIDKETLDKCFEEITE